jgi:hypothetical protein
MNSTTPAYSVVAFLLVMGSTLLVQPNSVFSQTTVETEEATTLETPAATSLIEDNYKREKLPYNDVFGDFVIGPGRFEVQLAPGESKTVEMIVTNRMGTTKRFTLTTEDVMGTNDPAKPVVLLGDDYGPYTLKDFISVDYPEFDLAHGERVRIPVTVSLPPDADPGGHYGTLLASIISAPYDQGNPDGAAAASVIVSRIGTLFFISNPGDTNPASELKEFTAVGGKTWFTKGPILFGIVHENIGQVHLNPYGEVRITNMFGDEVGFVELDPWFILPQSVRTREVSWNRELLIGRYTAVAQVNRGYENIVDEKVFVFWVVPWKLIGGVFVGLFILLLFLRFIATRFEFKRK